MNDATDGEVAANGEVAIPASGDESDAEDSYGGILTAFPYAIRASDSRVFQTYAGISAVFAAGIVLLFAFAIVVLLGASAGAPGGSFTFSRAFFLFLMLLVVAPLVTPVLLVARRHRRTSSDVRYDRGLALAGYGFLAALYVSLVISTPAELQEDPSGPLGAIAELLYGLPTLVAVVPPVAAVVVMYLAQRRFR
ncbi:hypothetical protein [Halosimplex amylolyticum]|uniref:hypothetical protein n=1 Tax=Halosimplex amylolyticum TaxID=3396616 RepID=UPI003F54A5EF